MSSMDASGKRLFMSRPPLIAHLVESGKSQVIFLVQMSICTINVLPFNKYCLGLYTVPAVYTNAMHQGLLKSD